MAKEKRSLFEWLTGSQAEDYTFDELESGGLSYETERRGKSISVSSTQPAAVLEEEEAGELSVDVYQTPTHIVIKAMIAGVRPEDLDVSITRDMVTIRGKRERHTEGTSGDFFFQELYWGSFAPTIIFSPKLDKGRQAKLKVKSN